MIITYGSKQTSSPKVCLSFGLNDFDFEMTIPFGAAILALYSIQNCGWLNRQTLQICFFLQYLQKIMTKELFMCLKNALINKTTVSKKLTC